MKRIVLAILGLIALCAPVHAQQQYDPGGKARVSNYCKTTTNGDTPCPASGSSSTANQGTAAPVTAGWPVIAGEPTDTTGTFTNATQSTNISTPSVDGYETATITINGTYNTATATFLASDDGGTTFYTLRCARTDSVAVESGYTGLINTSRAWYCPIHSFDVIRVLSSAVASGTVNVRISISSFSTSAAVTEAISADSTVGVEGADQSTQTSLTNAFPVQPGTGATFPVSAASLPLPTGASTSALQPTNAAAASTTSGQTGTLAFCASQTAIPTNTNGQSNPIVCNSRGGLNVSLAGTAQTSIAGGPIAAYDGAGTVRVYGVGTFIYDGTNSVVQRTIIGADNTGLGVAAVHVTPNSNVNSGIVPVVSSALEACHVLKASAGNLYTLTVTIQATTGIVQLFNATSAPGDGAVTPVWSQPVISNGTLGGNTWNWDNIPIRGSTGLTVCFSSATTPFTKTASATAMFSAGVE